MKIPLMWVKTACGITIDFRFHSGSVWPSNLLVFHADSFSHHCLRNQTKTWWLPQFNRPWTKGYGKETYPFSQLFWTWFPAQKLGNKPVPSRVPHHFHWKYKSIENARAGAFSGKRNTLLWKSNRNRKGGTCKDTETFNQSINQSIVMNYMSIGPNVEATTKYII